MFVKKKTKCSVKPASYKQVLLHLTKPYPKVTIAFLARELTIDVEELEQMLVDVILEGRLDASIDQIRGIVEINRTVESLETRKIKAISAWADAVSKYSESFCSKIL